MDSQQFIHFVEANQKELRRFLAGLCCGDTFLADDLAQDTFVKAYMTIDTLHDQSKLRPWIYRIAYNTFVSSRRTCRPTSSLDEASDMEATKSTAPDAPFDYQRLYLALDKLPSSQRAAILLYYLEGYPVSDIADISGQTAEAVRAQLSRGRRHLRSLIDEID